MDYMNKIKKVRKAHGISQNEMSDLLQTTQQQYSKYESGKQELPIRHLKTICVYLSISADWVLDIDTEKGRA